MQRLNSRAASGDVHAMSFAVASQTQDDARVGAGEGDEMAEQQEAVVLVLQVRVR